MQTVFIDRDGTLAYDVKYCTHPKDFKLYEDAAQAVKKLNDAGFKVIVVTNQSAIGRGYLTHSMLKRIHDKLRGELAKEHAHIDGIYYCPHHPVAKCDCRKPKAKLIHQAVRDHKLDIKDAWVIGDLPADVEMGKAIGAKTILVHGNTGADYDCDSLMDAVKVLLHE